MTDHVAIQQIGDGIESLLGYSASDLMTDESLFLACFHVDDRDLLDKLFAPVDQEQVDEMNLRLRQADGRIRCVKASYRKSSAPQVHGTLIDLLLLDAKSLPRTIVDASSMLCFLAMMENTDDFIYFKDRNHVFIKLSQSLAKLTSPSVRGSSLVGQTDYDVFPEAYADFQYRLAKQVFAGQTVVHEEQEIMVEDGGQGWIDNRVHPVRDETGEIIGLYGVARVITDKKRDAAALAESKGRLERVAQTLKDSEERLRFVLDGADLGFWDWNIVTGRVERNERWASMLGYTYRELQTTTKQWTDFIHPEDREKAWNSIFAVLEGRSDKHRIEYRMLHKDGRVRWILDQANVMQRDATGKPTRMCGTHSDVTERKLIEEVLEHQAYFDYLTQVSNRGRFMEHAEQELSRSKRYGGHLSLLMLDIDRFKMINDRYGHKAGDTVLKHFADLCRKTLREVDIIGRLGGEEFAVLLPETDRVEAKEVAERLRTRVETAEVQIDRDRPLRYTVSVGIFTAKNKEDDLDTILSHADKALYAAKQGGRNRVCEA